MVEPFIGVDPAAHEPSRTAVIIAMRLQGSTFHLSIDEAKRLHDQLGEALGSIDSSEIVALRRSPSAEDLRKARDLVASMPVEFVSIPAVDTSKRWTPEQGPVCCRQQPSPPSPPGEPDAQDQAISQ